MAASWSSKSDGKRTTPDDDRRRLLAWNLRKLFVSQEGTASGLIASLSGEVRSGWGKTRCMWEESMSPVVVYILLYAASTAPGDCDTRNAVDVVLGPESRNEIMCGSQAQEMFAKTSILPRDGEYVKISCVRRCGAA
jgi:hypothetical protein